MKLFVKRYIYYNYTFYYLFDIKSLEKFDRQKMYQIYDKWPEIAQQSWDSNQDEAGFIGMKHIVFAGMGGSGTLGDIFSSILSKKSIHVSNVKGYLLPKTADSNTLVIATSISGNTVETLNVLDSAHKLGCKIIAFSSGGKMQDYCVKHNIEYRKIPQMHSPRASFTGFLYSMLKILQPVTIIEKQDVTESIDLLNKLGDKISSNNISKNNPSLSLAQWISGIPLIYYPWGLQATASRFKSSLQENAKMHAIHEDVVEASHNGIVSWEVPSTIRPILLQGEDDYVKTKERWKIFKEYFKEKNIDYWEIFSVKGSILSKLINLIYLLDYASIYRAVLSGIDPSPISSIDYIKRKL